MTDSAAMPLRLEESVSNWIDVAGGIGAAGGVYAMLLVLVPAAGGAMGELLGLSPSHGLLDVLAVLLAGVFFSIAAGGAGVLWAFIVALLIMPFFHLFTRTMCLRLGSIWLGAILGGLVGLVASAAPWGFAVPTISWPLDRELLIITTLGPCLTTVLGQAGGALGGWRAARAQRDVALHIKPAPGVEPLPARARPKFQFRIRHLLWLTVWLSLLLAGATATGEPLVVLGIVGIWLVYQAATLYVGSRLAKWVARWRAARRERRRQVAPVAGKK